MNLLETSDETAFRQEVRTWMQGNLCAEFEPLRNSAGMGAPGYDAALAKRWEQRLASGGWIGLGWPLAHGGREEAPNSSDAFCRASSADLPTGPRDIPSLAPARTWQPSVRGQTWTQKAANGSFRVKRSGPPGPKNPTGSFCSPAASHRLQGSPAIRAWYFSWCHCGSLE